MCQHPSCTPTGPHTGRDHKNHHNCPSQSVSTDPVKEVAEKHLRIFFCRTNWIKAVQMCSKAREFALALAILECAIKPVAMLPVWKDSLGHTRYTLEHYMGLTQSNTSGKYKTQKTINKALIMTLCTRATQARNPHFI